MKVHLKILNCPKYVGWEIEVIVTESLDGVEDSVFLNVWVVAKVMFRRTFVAFSPFLY